VLCQEDTSSWDMSDRKVSVIVYGAFILGGLAIAGAAAYFALNKPVSECAPDIVVLSDPTSPLRIVEALLILEEEGVITTVDDALDSLENAQYVYDPDEDYEIEYWLFFEGVAAEFNIGCPKVEGTNLEYEGTRGL